MVSQLGTAEAAGHLGFHQHGCQNIINSLKKGAWHPFLQFTRPPALIGGVGLILRPRGVDGEWRSEEMLDVQ